MTTTRTVLVAGGGSAGHVSPMLATAEALVRDNDDIRVIALGTAAGLEADLVPDAGFELLTIDKVPFPRRPSLDALRFPGRLAAQIRTVRRLLREHDVRAIAGFGGYVCPPAYLAGAAARIPLIIHEANKRPGLANRLGARIARIVATAFEGSTLPKAVRIGMPMRRGIAHLDRAALRAEALEHFGLAPDRPTLLVTGGSLGAQRLNAAIGATAQEIAQTGAQSLHITGRGKSFPVEAEHYRQVEYVTRMELAYAAADLAVTRSGAGTVSELTAVGLPAVYVPLPIGNGEQALNGQDVVDAGGALMVHDADFTADAVRSTVIPLLADDARRTEMARAARGFGITDAAEALADLIRGEIRR
ncbi:undecaprenyldiphospho-muramoylpentapeptide beta-N-acetylglucosaminyltransferase [Helcobacillus massiliensis]|uniref:undecaprenyldiphospho-muramoylpentapeptide beta-N-acetylglucosaminyltransferase n=1 Tax=Helcobacillus massiliensis TaxID=521392 RepID=UPI0021A80873|nr:undecaprenyldiphospho-muramoylpentapeptide beta-N-acetylglucosaminyltransferase [Helcobacillus massiliensis]MCT1557833.1 undecaprenyldiphospho-muramoylpentapeptide beta-N-acetylglucosaminyltransferase [Helcobacillus massiliensis]MCT2036671.1 undecaprenyldiphospho-muramoylpentapeptide beta-N-acetylglucosaminyltransferase [Helcobacillus massiliensis]MCT2332142.1 undecaprenyldiphospho-muramoylpentapeptide beta-N-acetylglucosaminyltransferase [Helcobacillus massiliensis]